MLHRFRPICTFAVVLNLLLISTLSAQQAAYLSMQQRIIDVFKENKSSVLKVYTAVENPEDPSKSILRMGTGFFISQEGHILTTAKTTAQAKRIWVQYNGAEYSADPKFAYDLMTNVSLIKLNTLPPDFKHINLNTEAPMPEEGSIIVSIASQLGMPPGPIMGMITGQNVRYGNLPLPTVYLRANISTGSGEGGSPVFDLNGRIAGITIATLPEIESCFILPVKAIRRVRDDLISSGKPLYALFGLFTKESVDPEFGLKVVIDKIIEDSPASDTGLKTDDIIIKIGDYAISNEHDLRDAFFFTPAESMVTIIVQRGERILDFTFKVGTHSTKDSENQKIAAYSINQAQAKESIKSKTPDVPTPQLLNSEQVEQIKK